MPNRNLSDDAREVAAEWVPIRELTPWDRNPRDNDEAAKDVAKSIKRFGWGAPIVARKADGVVIAGHTRLKAAQLLKLDVVPVRFVDIDPTDARLMALADNRLGEKATWDEQALADLLGEFSLEDVGLAGWSSKDLEKMAGDLLKDDAPSNEPKLDGLNYQIVIECEDESQQGELLERFESEGFTCRPLIL